MQREILFGQRNFETFSYYAVQGIFFLTVLFEVCDQKMRVFSKRNKKRPQEGLIDCSEIYIYF